jgi:hypothetical protein
MIVDSHLETPCLHGNGKSASETRDQPGSQAHTQGDAASSILALIWMSCADWRADFRLGHQVGASRARPHNFD